MILLNFLIFSACNNIEKTLCKVLSVKEIPGHSKEVHFEIMKNIIWGYSRKKYLVCLWMLNSKSVSYVLVNDADI